MFNSEDLIMLQYIITYYELLLLLNRLFYQYCRQLVYSEIY